MAELPRPAYSYRDDPAVPRFDDALPLFVFDGACVLCSGGAAWLMRHDPTARLRFAAATSPLGAALYRHYGADADATYLLVEGGRAWTESAGYLRLAAVLGGGWQLLRIGALVPAPVRDAAYRLLARHRYRWFGTVEQCALLTPEQRARLL